MLLVWMTSGPVAGWSQVEGAHDHAALSMSNGAVIRGDTGIRTLSLVFTGDQFAEGLEHIAGVLDNRHIKASFFLTGDFYRNPRFESMIRSLKAGGHYLGAHSDRHLLYCDWEQRDSLLVTREQFKEDLEQNYLEMSRFGIRKEEAPFFLPPYEWYNDTIGKWTGELGLRLISYTPGTLSHTDYTLPGTPGYRNSLEILNSILTLEQKDPRGLNGFILLMHTGSGPGRTDKFHDMLGPLADTLAYSGYTFVPLSELLPYPGED